jgi:hypothetical protein
MAELLFFVNEEDRADSPDLRLDRPRQAGENLFEGRTCRDQFKNSTLA